MRRKNLVDGVWLCGNKLHEMVPENQWRVSGRAGVHCRECRIVTQRRKRERRREKDALNAPPVRVVECQDPDCRQVVDSHGCYSRRMCSKHYARWRKARAKPPVPRKLIPPLPKLAGAACTGVLEPLWDAEVDGETMLQRNLRLERAMAVCWSCPIKAACKSARGENDVGVWGGCLFMVTT